MQKEIYISQTEYTSRNKHLRIFSTYRVFEVYDQKTKHTDSPPDHKHGDTKLATDFLSQSSACPQLQNILPWGSLFIPAFIIWTPAFFLWPLLELGMMFPLTHYLYNFYASTTSKAKMLMFFFLHLQ